MGSGEGYNPRISIVERAVVDHPGARPGTSVVGARQQHVPPEGSHVPTAQTRCRSVECPVVTASHRRPSEVAKKVVVEIAHHSMFGPKPVGCSVGYHPAPPSFRRYTKNGATSPRPIACPEYVLLRFCRCCGTRPAHGRVLELRTLQQLEFLPGGLGDVRLCRLHVGFYLFGC